MSEETKQPTPDEEKETQAPEAAEQAPQQEPEKQETYCRNAREHALRNHDRQGNYQATLEVYGEIAGALVGIVR